jgi:RNA polymerase sigma-70 factor (ECF subfamily)
VDEVRRRIRQPVTPVELPEDGVVDEDSADLALRNLDTRAALDLIATLPPLQAEVIVLRVVAGLPVDMAAEIVGRSAGAVRVAAHRGLRTLARIMTERGVTL